MEIFFLMDHGNFTKQTVNADSYCQYGIGYLGYYFGSNQNLRYYSLGLENSAQKNHLIILELVLLLNRMKHYCM